MIARKDDNTFRKGPLVLPTVRQRISAFILGAAMLIPGGVFSQVSSSPGATTTTSTPTTSVLPQSAYLVPILPQDVRSLLLRFGNRFQQPGNERLTLAGTYTDSNGASTATVISEITGNIRVQLTGAETKTVLSVGTQTTANGAAATSGDQNLIDSLMADSPQTFFYSWSKKAGIRYLGSRFRTDNFKSPNPNYNGPWYDVYEVVAPATGGASGTQRRMYYIDTYTRQFVKTRYTVVRSGSSVDVQTVYSGWSQVNGQMEPGRIERFENGKSVFALAVTTAATSPAVADGIFPPASSATPTTP